VDMVLRILESLPLSRMVEVGCGAGEFIAELAELKPRVHLVGVDVDGKAIGEAYATACALRPASRMGFACGDCAALPLAACSADVVVFRGLLHHVEEFALALAEARRVLDEGGLLLIQDARRVPAPLFEEMNEALRQSGCPRDVHPGFGPRIWRGNWEHSAYWSRMSSRAAQPFWRRRPGRNGSTQPVCSSCQPGEPEGDGRPRTARQGNPQAERRRGRNL
jgi:ubiquinone/menaquinone biosynthesis C-methylase UbiE